MVVVTVKYSEVEEILKNECYGCHNGSSTNFNDYNSLKTYLQKDSTKFIRSITHAPGARNMPESPNAKLPEDKIQKILSWIRQGINP